MEDFDKFWNYNDPVATEAKFKELLAISESKDTNYLLQLQTQIARTYSLRAKFVEAHDLLDTVERQLAKTPNLAQVRYHLERGRTFNSSGNKADAKAHFETARTIAEKLNADFYSIDAIHMLAIIANPDEAIKINQEGILLAEQSADQKAKNWLGAFYNNLGWSYFDKGTYENALSIFLRSLQWRETKGSAPEILIAKWCVARTLRALGRIDDAIKIQLGLFEETTQTGQPDGYVHEELGELFLIRQDQLKYPFHFEKAYELLSKEVFLQRNEAPRLERIKRLAGL